MIKYILTLILLLPTLTWAGPEMLLMMTNGMGTVSESPASEWAIEDDFSTNTLASYTEFGTVTDGALGYSATYGHLYNTGGGGTITWNYHSTDLGSDNQVVQAVLCDRAAHTSAYGSGVVLRANGTTGHGCYIDVSSNRFSCEALGGSGTNVYRTWTTNAWADDACHLVQISVDATDVYTFEVDFNDDGDFGDTNEQVGDSTANSSYTGTKVGVGFRGTAVSTDTTNYLDNFKAKAQ